MIARPDIQPHGRQPHGPPSHRDQPLGRQPRMRPLRPAAAATLGALALAGCGLSHGSTAKGAHIEVTRGFGRSVIASNQVASLPVDATLQSMLVKARVSPVGAKPSVFVNGIAPTGKAAQTSIDNGDQIWADAGERLAGGGPGGGPYTTPAVVGSYPEPFSSGAGGRQFPTVLTCAGSTASKPCTEVARSLTRAGVKVADQELGTGSGSDSLAVLVGTFAQLRGVIASELLQAGPDKSGVYGQFVGTAGQALELDDPAGQVVQTLHAGAGLIAATEQPGLNEPVWLVTGTDGAGVAAAAAELTPARLHDHFAVAVSGGRVIPLPVASGG